MSANHDNDARFDGVMRRLHRQSLDQLEPATLSRLRAARRDALASRRPHRGFRWGPASATAAVFALAIGVLAIDASWLRPDTQAPPGEVATRTPSATTGGDVADALLAAEVEAVMATFNEDPDLYLWLAANDNTLPPALDR